MITLSEVTPHNKSWDKFIDLSVEYIVMYWPEVLEKMQFSDFRNAYRDEILDKCSKGNRGLFTVNRNNHIIGIVNAYITKKKECSSLYIAEFFLIESERGKGIGRIMKEQVARWGHLHGATKMVVEVDKDFTAANKFWSSFKNLTLDITGERNIYVASLNQTKNQH